MFKSVSIIYPVFNEEKRLQKTFLDIERFEKEKAKDGIASGEKTSKSHEHELQIY